MKMCMMCVCALNSFSSGSFTSDAHIRACTHADVTLTI